MKARDRIATIRFVVFGPDARVRSEQLDELAATVDVALADVATWDGQTLRGSSRSGLGVAVIVTLYDDHSGIASIRRGLGYAVEELAEGIVEAGGRLSDGTHVQICRL